MKKKRVWRYYCIFCNRARCQAYAISEHEKRCTMNPSRECRMCGLANRQPKPITELIAGATSLVNLKFLTHDCPACILAAIRQGSIDAYSFEFDYQEACKSYLEALNQDEQIY